MVNISWLHMGKYAEGLTGKIDRHALFCLLVYVIYALFSFSNYYEFCLMY